MLRRRMLQAGFATGVFAVSVLGLSPAANASPTGFTAKSVHAGGAGKLAVEMTGGLTWYSRSAAVTSIRLYANAGECGYAWVYGYQGSVRVDATDIPLSCGGTTGKWFSFNDIALDGSDVAGGITEVRIDVYDHTHKVHGYAYCARVSVGCAEGQY